MKFNPDKFAFFRQVRQDTHLKVFLTLFIVFHVPYFLTYFTFDQLQTYSWVLSTSILLPYIVLILWPGRSDLMQGNERVFWKVYRSLSYCGGYQA